MATKTKRNRSGDHTSETEKRVAGKAQERDDSRPDTDTSGVPYLCTELQALQRQRARLTKSRIGIANNLRSNVAGTIGYHAGLEDDERKKLTERATKIIDAISEGLDCDGAEPVRSFVLAVLPAFDGFEKMENSIVKAMLKLVVQLPVAGWMGEVEQRGIGLGHLGAVIGECGDLSNYPNPAKVWRRMGCAPFEHNGKNLMGATWKSGREGKLPASEWEAFGYSPRRRSLAYLIGDGIVKQNQTGPYRARYIQAKVTLHEKHPEYDWKSCKDCEGETCRCGGIGQTCKRAHLHGMLLATKLFLKNLWIEWQAS